MMVHFRYRDFNSDGIMFQKLRKGRPKVVVANWVHPEVIERLRQACLVVENPTRDPFTPQELLGHSRRRGAHRLHDRVHR